MGVLIAVGAGVVLLAFIVIFWVTGATRPKSKDRPGSIAAAEPRARTPGID
jgi:hypothetical protein